MLRVTTESGPKYTLGKLRFANASDKPLLFTDALLRKQFDLEEDDLFDLTKIRHGLESICRMYGSKGHIDATPEPDTTIDEGSSRIDLLIKVDEQKRYLIGKIEFLGMDPAAQKSLGTEQKIGDVFNVALWRSFFEENKTHLPRDASAENNMRVHRNVDAGTVDITLDFRPCPKIQPSNY